MRTVFLECGSKKLWPLAIRLLKRELLAIKSFISSVMVCSKPIIQNITVTPVESNHSAVYFLLIILALVYRVRIAFEKLGKFSLRIDVYPKQVSLGWLLFFQYYGSHRLELFSLFESPSTSFACKPLRKHSSRAGSLPLQIFGQSLLLASHWVERHQRVTFKYLEKLFLNLKHLKLDRRQQEHHALTQSWRSCHRRISLQNCQPPLYTVI